MKKLQAIVLFLAVAGLSLTACKKEETTPSNTGGSSSKSTLIAKTWRVTEAQINGQVSSDPSLNSIRFTFNSNGTYTLLQDGDSDTGTWEFNADQTAVILDRGTQFEWTMTLVTLTSSSMRLTWSEDGANFNVLMQPV